MIKHICTHQLKLYKLFYKKRWKYLWWNSHHSENAFSDIEKLRTFLEDVDVGVVGWWQQNGNFLWRWKKSFVYCFNANYSNSFI